MFYWRQNLTSSGRTRVRKVDGKKLRGFLTVVGVGPGGILGKLEPMNEKDPLAVPELDASRDDDEEGLEPLGVTFCGQEGLCSYH